MSLTDWINSFRAMHEKARSHQFGPGERQAYEAAREELARALVAAQRLNVKPGETPRQALRVALAMQLDLEVGTEKQRVITTDLSVGGFGCLLAKPVPTNEVLGFSLKLPGGGEPIVGRAKVLEVKKQPSHHRASFVFEGFAGTNDAERIQLAVFDAALAQLKT